jgi:hypothetical protein
VVAITLLSGHVAPSVDENNRYVKLTPLGDRVRLAYTVFYGEVPGAAERRTIDTSGDGQISDAEARAFADRVGAEIGAALEIEVDGTVQPVRWTTVDAGMGTPAVAAGSFSVDLVAYLCLPALAGRHRILVRDRFRLPRSGETEARVEDGPPGVTIERAHVGQADDPSHDYRYTGPDGPLATDGLELVFTVGSQVAPSADGACAAPAPRRSTTWLPITIAGGLALLGAVAWLLVHVRSRARRRTAG